MKRGWGANGHRGSVVAAITVGCVATGLAAWSVTASSPEISEPAVALERAQRVSPLPPTTENPSGPDANARSLPPELDGLALTMLLDETFDAAAEFSNPAAVSNCINGSPAANCAMLPIGWTDFLTSEWWHPDEFGAGAEASLQINDLHARGGTGKSLVIWDESRGDTGSWGSDAMLARQLDPGYRDVYVEYWITFQPGYRWHHLDPANTQGINSAKILRIGHRDEGRTPFSFSASGFTAPLTFVNVNIWTRDGSDESADRTNRVGLGSSVRCDPQATSYRCPGYEGVSTAYSEGPFEQVLGDGEWHKIGARMALNSAPGANDGILQLWFDDQLVTSASDTPFLSAAAPSDQLLNSVVIGGNVHNYPEPESERFEQWYAIDDVRIFAID